MVEVIVARINPPASDIESIPTNYNNMEKAGEWELRVQSPYPMAEKRGCDASSYPVYIVNATSAKDVQAGVDFAREHSVCINAKSTGHDRSSIPGSLSIWTHCPREKTFHRYFQLE